MTPCEQLAAALAADADPLAAAASGELAVHVGTCLRCQAELARHRRLLRGLAALRTEEFVLPPSLLSDVLAAVERAATRSATRAALRRRGLWSALCLATAAVALGVAVRFDRHRPRRRPADAAAAG